MDIWQTMGMTMDEWMKWYEDTRQPLGTVASRITIGEIEAVRYEESTLWTTLWSGEKYIYRLWYTHRGDQSGEEFYKRVLNSVGFLNEEPIKGEDASQSFQGLSLEGFATVNPLVTTCCGYTSPGNPFECCNNKGNCVWWVYYKYGYVPFRGDAGKWYGQVPDYPDWRRGRYPNRGMNIAWWSGSPGHVAFIANYPGGGTVTITEMLICTSCGRTRNLSVTAPEGYMWTIYN
ncbi:CHAP domain-containing protein [Bellilinea caldifistulae]|uniref:Peptidase C51 domain-containing protein n=1 Tax=Bellilinea caldifistulae TaxID=360411 RepID=A0A0P6XAW5_9CHLR|nr:CHAP domain-containing protein [Bellilinea caldifistulae]KPL79283.1 hypothetical protein AC812_00195 [Bellilinea caldifistulae]